MEAGAGKQYGVQRMASVETTFEWVNVIYGGIAAKLKTVFYDGQPAGIETSSILT
jgi:hypothetical protein